jgi:RNA polymerase sigma-70 factor (ECF subfamily)
VSVRGGALGKPSSASGEHELLRPLGEGGDEVLIRRVADGDPRAFEELYRSYHPRLARFLFNLLRRPQLVEEVLNDTMLVVWKRPGAYNGTSLVSTWIFAIAYRKALKALKLLDDPVQDPSVQLRRSEDASPEKQAGDRQVGEILVRAIGELSREHRTVVDLAYFHGVGYREIAQIMGCPVDTVKTRMFHARRHLKRTLSGSSADWL